MIIEQTMMKSMKTDGGVARGRSTQESVLSRWVYGMHSMNTVCNGLEELSNVKMNTTDQHVDASDSRLKRDINDQKKLLEWFLIHDPFPYFKKIMSIANGVVGDTTINCHNARKVRIASMNKMIGQTFNNIKLKHADKVPPISISRAVKVHN
uniref:Uncharacterized protein n=1 Tax=Schizaphis graminum TaxID=13262 RepID=A0A2S2PKW0_SCHGA